MSKTVFVHMTEVAIDCRFGPVPFPVLAFLAHSLLRPLNYPSFYFFPYFSVSGIWVR